MENHKTKLSIIIPTWNTSKITKKCIDTITEYLPKNYFQIIIVDNGSTDDTPQILGKLKSITYIRNSSNLGFSKANNIGVKKAKGEYLLFLNSDMELVDSSLVEMLNFIDSNSTIGMIGPKFLNPDLTDQGSVIPLQTPLNAIKEYWFNIQNSYTKYTPQTIVPVKVDNISGGAVLIRKSDFIKIGGWDEKYFFYYEDLELCRQIRKQKLNIYYFPSCKVIHRHGASGSNLANASNQWKRLIPSSIKYHGLIEHYIIYLIIWISQKFSKIFP